LAALFHFIIAPLQHLTIYRPFFLLFEACPDASFRDNAIMTNPHQTAVKTYFESESENES
jgi:hypothetical protein